MTYVPPSLNDLIQRATELQDKYSKNNPERNHLIKIIAVIHDFIDIKYKSGKFSEKELQDICLGVWCFALEAIALEYKFLNPSFKQGYFFKWGSTLYKEMADYLDITEENKPDDRFKLIHLEKFYNFAFTTRYINLFSNEDVSRYKDDAVNLENIEQKIILTMDKIITRMSDEVMRILNAIPTKEADKADLQSLPENYIKEKEKCKKKICVLVGHDRINEERLFMSQLASAIGEVASKESGQYDDTTLSSSQIIYRGIRLYILYVINNEYYLRSGSNSALYEETSQLLKAKNPNDIPKDEQLNYLIALQEYISQHDVVTAIAEYGKKTFKEQNLLNNIHLKMHVVRGDLEKIITPLHDKQIPTGWPVTRTFSWLGATIVSTTSYGIGHMLGRVANETHTAATAKSKMSTAVNAIGTMYMGSPNGNSFGYMAADFLLGSILARTFGKGTETVCMLAGAAVGASIGFPLDLLQKAVRGSGQYLLASSNPSPNESDLIANCDLELIQTLLNLPEEVFSEDKKKILTRSSKGLDIGLLEMLQQDAPATDNEICMKRQ